MTVLGLWMWSDVAGIGRAVRRLISIALFQHLVLSVTARLGSLFGTSSEYWHDWNANWTTLWLNTSVLSTTCAWKSVVDSRVRKMVNVSCIYWYHIWKLLCIKSY